MSSKTTNGIHEIWNGIREDETCFESIGFPLVFHWFSIGFPLVFHWFSIGFPLDFESKHLGFHKGIV